MVNNLIKVHFALLDDFYYRAPAILFLCTADGLSRFAAVLRGLAAATDDTRLPLEAASLFEAHGGTRVTLTVGDVCRGMKRRPDADKDFDWILSCEQTMGFVAMLDGLVASETPAHQYLDSDARDDVAVIVSREEYPIGMLSS